MAARLTCVVPLPSRLVLSVSSDLPHQSRYYSGRLYDCPTVQPGQIWAASGLVFKQRGRIPAWVIALWGLSYDEPWALVTNASHLTGHEYARRNWQEQSFRDLKSGGWHWHESRMRQPDHVAHLLVSLVVAYVWTVALASLAIQSQVGHALIARADALPERYFSLFREGLDFLCQQLEDFSTFFRIVFFPDFRFT
ncbi:MAG: hypothetical protein ABI947_12605 [Chloroflexota bacterium]